MNVQTELLHSLDEVLGLAGRAHTFDRNTPLLGALPELDSMAVVSLLTALEARLGVSLPDDELQGSDFATVGSLTDLLERLLRG